MKIKAYAKVNLRLEVVGKYNDGFHELQMINDRVKSLYDIITIKKSNHNEVIFDKKELNEMKFNMCLDLLNFMTEYYKFKYFYSISIKKNIPIGAGLGGGSADLAAIIIALNKLEHLKLSVAVMEKLALRYSSDGAYCIHNNLCFVSGFGNVVKPLNLRRNKKLFVVTNDVNASTRVVFSKVNKIFNKTSSNLLESYVKSEDYKSLFRNDLESFSFESYSKLYIYKLELSKFGYVNMSGTGSSFIVYPTNKKELLNYLGKNKLNYYIF